MGVEVTAWLMRMGTTRPRTTVTAATATRTSSVHDACKVYWYFKMLRTVVFCS